MTPHLCLAPSCPSPRGHSATGGGGAVAYAGIAVNSTSTALATAWFTLNTLIVNASTFDDNVVSCNGTCLNSGVPYPSGGAVFVAFTDVVVEFDVEVHDTTFRRNHAVGLQLPTTEVLGGAFALGVPQFTPLLIGQLLVARCVFTNNSAG